MNKHVIFALIFIEFIITMVTAVILLVIANASVQYGVLGSHIGYFMGTVSIVSCILLIRRVPEFIEKLKGC